MIRKISYLILLLILPVIGFSQNNNIKGRNLKIANKSKLIGNVVVGSSSFDASAVLTVTSSTQGALMPRMNTTARDNISTPADGLLIFNTSTNQYEFFESTWKAVGGGNTIYNSDDNLTSNRTVTMGTNSLIFSGNQTTFKGINAAFASDVVLFEDNAGTHLMQVSNNGSVGIGTDGFTGGRLTVKSKDDNASFAYLAQKQNGDFLFAVQANKSIAFGNTIGPYPILSDFTLKDYRRIGFDNTIPISDIAWFRGGSLKIVLQANMSSAGSERFDIFVGGANTVDIGLTVDIDGNVGVGVQNTFGTLAERVYAQISGVAPTSSPADMFQLYSADHGGAGTASPFFRTEEGDVIKLFKTATGYTTFTNLTTVRTADADATSVAELADILGTLIEDLKKTGLIAP